MKNLQMMLGRNMKKQSKEEYAEAPAEQAEQVNNPKLKRKLNRNMKKKLKRNLNASRGRICKRM